MFSNRGSNNSISHAYWCQIEHRWQDKAVNAAEKLLEIMKGIKLTTLEQLVPLLGRLYGPFTGERMRRLLDAEPTNVLIQLAEILGLQLESISPDRLRSDLKMFCH